MAVEPAGAGLLEAILPDLVKTAIGGLGGLILGGLTGWVGGRRAEQAAVKDRRRQDWLNSIAATKSFLMNGLNRLGETSSVPIALADHDDRLVGDEDLFAKWLLAVVDLLPRGGLLEGHERGRIAKLSTQIGEAMDKQRDLAQEGRTPLYAQLDTPRINGLRVRLDNIIAGSR